MRERERLCYISCLSLQLISEIEEVMDRLPQLQESYSKGTITKVLQFFMANKLTCTCVTFNLFISDYCQSYFKL